MKERPIIFSGPMVRALLDGRKSQTRRLIRGLEDVPADMSVYIDSNGWLSGLRPKAFDGWKFVTDIYGRKVRCPHGATGDRLWIRETWRQVFPEANGPLEYRADYGEDAQITGGWNSPLFMPRWTSRITLEITGLRVQRLQDISEEDARAEGLKITGPTVNSAGEVIDDRPGYLGYGSLWHDPRRAFETLWDAVNGKRAPWSSNPWVWVLDFKRVEQEAKAA